MHYTTIQHGTLKPLDLALSAGIHMIKNHTRCESQAEKEEH